MTAKERLRSLTGRRRASRPGGSPTSRPLKRVQHGWLRHAVGVLALAGLLVVVLAYRYATEPERVRRAARDYLQALVGGRVTVERARFSLFGGIELTGVSIAEPGPAGEAGTSAGGPVSPEAVVLSCSDLRLRQDPLAALRGRLVADEIVALRPTLSIYRHSDTGRYNVGELFRLGAVDDGGVGAELPTVRLRNARLRWGRVQGEVRHVVEDLTLSIVANPRPDGHSYELSWEGGGKQRSAGRTLLDLRARTVADLGGGLPWLTVEGVMLAAAARFEGADEWCELLGLTGQLQVRDFQVSTGSDEASAPRATVELRDATLSLPLDEEELTEPSDRRYLRFTEVNGRLDLGVADARASFNGLLHGAACQLDVCFSRGTAGGLTLSDVGFNGQVHVEGLPLPAVNDPQGPEEARFIGRWKKLRDFYRDYDPHGTVNLEVSVSKAPGPEAAVRLEYARLEGLDCDASYRHFPYRLERLSGVVEYRPEGMRLIDLRAERAGGQVVVNGTIDEPRYRSPAKLSISGRDIPIDRALHDALGERYQRMWDNFELAGTADIDVELDRASGDAEGSAPWRTVVEAYFTGLDAEFGGFCYPIEQITGRLGIDSQGFTVTDLGGRCGTGRVVFNGSARMDDNAVSDLDVRLAATDVSFDDRLFGALSAEARDLLGRFDPRGRFDLTGQLSLDPHVGGIAYDLTASLREAGFTYRDLPVPIDGVTGEVQVTPQRVTVADLSGRWGDTLVAAEGQFDTTGEEPTTHLLVDCSKLRLDDRLRDLLPEQARRAFDEVEVTGSLDTSTSFSQVGRGESRRVRQTTQVRARGVGVTWARLPLPLSDVHGVVTIAEDAIEFADLVGRAGEGSFSLAGALRRTEEALTGRLAITVLGLSFTEELRSALPWRLRRTWNKVSPEGGFDLDLPRLDLWVPASAGPARWEFDAELTLADAGFDFGVKTSNLAGTLGGTGRLDETGLSFSGRVELTHAEVNDHHLTDLTGRLVRTGSEGALVLDEVGGRAYGGLIDGRAEVNQAASPARYSCAVTLLDVDLAELLSARRPPESAPIDAAGQVDARLYLDGAVGDPNSTRGGGQVSIDKGRVFRLPLLLKILGVLGLNAPAADREASQTVSAEFFVLGREVELRDILLRDKTVAMIGAGRLQRDPSELDLRLVAVSPHRWFRLPIVTELVEGAARELVEVRVRGPLGEPQISANPLRGVSGAMETLLSRPLDAPGNRRD